MALEVHRQLGIRSDHRQLLEVLQHAGAVVSPVPRNGHGDLSSAPAQGVRSHVSLQDLGLVAVDVDVQRGGGDGGGGGGGAGRVSSADVDRQARRLLRPNQRLLYANIHHVL